MTDKLLAPFKHSSSLPAIDESPRGGDGVRGAGEKGADTKANFSKLPPLRVDSTKQQQQQQQQQQQKQPTTSASTIVSSQSHSPSSSYQPHPSPPLPPPQEDAHIHHDLQQETQRRVSLQRVASAYLAKHDPSDLPDAHHTTTTASPTTTTASHTTASHTTATHTTTASHTIAESQTNASNASRTAYPSAVSSLFPRDTTMSNFDNHADSHTVRQSIDPHNSNNNNSNNNNSNNNQLPTLNSHQSKDLTTHIHDLIVQAQVDVAHAQHRLQTLLHLEATLKDQGLGLVGQATHPHSTPPPSQTPFLHTLPNPTLPSPPISTYNEATEKDET